MTTTPAESRESGRPRLWDWAVYGIGVLLIALVRVPPAEDREGKGGAYVAGYVLASVALIVGVSLAIRALYVKLIRRDDRPIWSPWVFAIAVPIALVLSAGRLAGDG